MDNLAKKLSTNNENTLSYMSFGCISMSNTVFIIKEVYKDGIEVKKKEELFKKTILKISMDNYNKIYQSEKPIKDLQPL